MPLPPKLKSAVLHYLAGVLAAAFNGGIGSVAAIAGIDGVSLSGVANDARVLNGHEMLSAFLGACVIHGIFWLKAHPLPENFESAPPFMAQVTAPPSQKTPPASTP